MRTLLKTFMIFAVFAASTAFAFDKKSAEIGVKVGMYIAENKAEILNWSRLLAYKTLKNEAKKYDCKHAIANSQNASVEYIRGLCTFVNQKSKDEVLSGLSGITYAALNAPTKAAKEQAVCTATLAYLITQNYKMAGTLNNISKQNGYSSSICKKAQNIVKKGLAYEVKFHGKMRAGDVCAD